MAGFCLTAKCPSCYSSVVVDTVFAAGTLKIYFGTTLGRPDSPATALLHSQPYPVRINIEGRAPQKSSNPSFDRYFLFRWPPPAVVMEPPRAQISIK